MSIIGNLIWFLFGGIFAFIFWILSGLLCCITIVGIPLGLQCFKIGSFSLFPFGKEVIVGNFGIGGFLGNIIWIILLGWELCIFHLVVAIIFSITIVGIPFALQHFKLARLSIIPFGAEIYRR